MSKVLKVQAERLNIPVSEIKEYELNNKVHGEKQIEAIKNSIKRFSYIDEIVIDKNNVIILGHGRYQAIKDMGYKEVAVKRLFIDANDEKALRYLHNRLAEYDVNYVVKNIEYEIRNGVDFSLGNLEDKEFIGEFNITNLDETETGQINSNDAKIYEKQQEDIGNVDDLIDDMSDVELPLADEGVVRGIQIPVDSEIYNELFTEFSKAIKNKVNVGTLLLEHLTKLNKS